MFCIVIYLFSFPLVLSSVIPFLTKPNPIEYVACGQTLDLPWSYNSSKTYLKINWYHLNNNTKIIEEVASRDNTNSFFVNPGAIFVPAKENRLSFLPNAGLRITNVKETDESFLSIDVDFDAPQGTSKGETEIRVYVAPTIVSSLLSTGSDAVALINVTKEFKCDGSARPRPIIKWYKDGVQITNKTSKYVIVESTIATGAAPCSSTQVSSSLAINNIQVNDAGMISCSTESENGKTSYYNQTVKLVVEYMPGAVDPTNFTVSPSDASGGDFIAMSCLANSIPSPSYDILFNNVIISHGTPQADVAFQYNITDAKSYNEGNYSCRATNTRGSEPVFRHLNVSVKPRITYASSSLVELDVGSDLNITCIGEGDPIDVTYGVKWTKSNSTLNLNASNTEHFSNATLTQVQSNLLKFNISKDAYGLYECMAKNFLGEDATRVWVYVNSNVNITNSNLPSASIPLVANSVHSFECTAQGYPKPTITWFSNGNPFSIDPNNITLATSNATGVWEVTSRITLKLSPEFAGTLRCTAENPQSSDARSANVVMNFAPEVSLVALDRGNIVVNGTSIFTASVNDTVILYCFARSQPAPSKSNSWYIRWFKNGIDITNVAGGNETITSGTFSSNVTSWIRVEDITKDENNDIYSCKATNSIATTTKDIKTLVLHGQITKRPSNPTCAALGQNATFDWQYEYTQPLDFIKWEKFSSNNQDDFLFTLGLIVRTSDAVIQRHMSGVRYLYHPDTLSGLTVTNVVLADEGWYGVKINFLNSPVVLLDIVYLQTIIYPHEAVITPEEPFVVENGNVTLTCTSQGKPAPQITWYKNYNYNTALTNTSKYRIESSIVNVSGNESVTTSILVIVNADYNDLANYTCKSSTLCNSPAVMDHVLLKVYYPPKNTTLTATANPVLANQSVIFKCNADAYPMPIYYAIYFNSSLVHNSTNGTYIINPVYNFYEGFYECKPRNLAGIEDKANLSLQVYVPPVLLSHNSLVIALEGANATLTCTIYGDPQPVVYWYKVSGGIENDITTTDTVLHGNATLFIVESNAVSLNVSNQDAGSYFCYANNSYGYVEQNVILRVYYAVNITSHTLVQPLENYTEGDKVIHECIAKGYPAPITFQWLLNGKVISDQPYTTTSLSSGSDYVIVKSVITINSVDKDDRGVFSCNATNIAGNDTESTIVDVYFSPVFTGKPDPTKHVNLASSLTLSCVAQANEMATINWFKNGILLTPGDGVTILPLSVLDQMTSTIKVNPVTLSTAALFTCEASNHIGKVNTSTVVNVCYPVEIKSFPPTIITASEYQLNFPIQCIATGNPLPTIEWYRGNQSMTFPNPDYTLSETKNDTSNTIISILTINTVSLTDYGNWTCLAKNTIAGNLQAQDEDKTLLTISYDPVFVPYHPSSIVYVNETESITIRCRVKSYPKPYVWWELPGGVTNDGRFTFATTIVTDTTEYSIVEHSMTITPAKISDYNEYKCFANNTKESINKTTKLIVYYQAKPDTNQVLTLTEGHNILYLQVNATSNPRSNFTFLFNNTAISGSGQKMNTFVNSSSEIQTVQSGVLLDGDVTEANSGYYKITTCNLVGCKTDEWKVIVNYVPNIVTSLQVVTHVNVTGSTTLTCTYSANPIASPLIAWKRANNIISNGNGYSITETVIKTGEFDNTVTSILTISGTSLNQSGVYSCEGNNSVGKQMSTTNLTVCYPPVFQTNLFPTPLTITEGQPINLNVLTFSYPNATYQWYKDNIQQLPNLQQTDKYASNPPATDIFAIYQTSELTNSTASRQMSGMYNVTACNLVGCTESVTATLVVNYLPTHQEVADQVALAGASVNFTCVVDGQPAPTVTWWKDGTTQLQNADPEIHVYASSSTYPYKTVVTSILRLTNINKADDAAFYTCRASNIVGTTDESANLTIYYPPIQVNPLQDIIVNVSSPLHLGYEIRSFPKSNFTWTHNGTLITDTSLMSSTIMSQTAFDLYQTGNLDYPSGRVTRDVAGIYNVTAANGYGNVGDSACVIVQYPPHITTRFTNQTIRVKSTNATLVCDVEAHPIANVKWYRQGVEVTASTSGMVVTQETIYSTKFDTTVRSTLTLPDIQKDKSDNYTCKAANILGESNDTTRLIVHYPPVIIPDFVPTPFKVNELTLEKLTCNVDSNPASTTLWFMSSDGGKTYDPVNAEVMINYQKVPVREYEVIYNSSLMFVPKNIERTDSGLYYCLATNYLGSTRRDANIEVLYLPTFIAPGIMSGYQTVNIGSSSTIECQVTSNPESNIKWFKDDTEIPSTKYTTTVVSTNGNIVTKKSILSFTSTVDGDLANYTCQATNSLGKSEQSEVLNVLYPPRTISENITVTLNQGESLALICGSLSNPPATHQWIKDGTSLTNIYDTFQKNAEPSDSGTYRCTPINSLGYGEPVWYRVNIRAAPTITMSAQCVESTDIKGDTVSVCSCNGTGYPEPNVYWTKYKSDVVLSNSTTLLLPANINNDGAYQCHVRNEAGYSTTAAAVALYGELMSSWTVWSGCNNTCGSGFNFRSRICNSPPCIEDVVEWGSCVGNCILKPIPLMVESADDWYIMLYVLLPLAFVATILAALYLARYRSKSDDDPVIIPINKSIVRPPDMPPQVLNQVVPAGYANNGYISEVPRTAPNMESIEVNLLFEEEVPLESDTDIIDFPNELSQPVSASIPDDTGSVNSDFSNFYEELPLDHELRTA